MRGARVRDTHARAQARFIPAHAGSTGQPKQGARTQAVHPRACGEHGGLRPPDVRRPGSSPRMRGAPESAAVSVAVLRFIPAHAGSTIARSRPFLAVPVHPRACGEHDLCLSPAITPVGSSPRMRGAQGTLQAGRPRGRFIPAHAGSTSSTSRSSCNISVHPRACGEHLRGSLLALPCVGSSPRMRGALHLVHDERHIRRFIPAHAGSTCAAAMFASRAAVHPRACGEHQALQAA